MSRYPREAVSQSQASALRARMRRDKQAGIPVTHMTSASGLSPGAVNRAIHGLGSMTKYVHDKLAAALDQLEEVQAVELTKASTGATRSSAPLVRAANGLMIHPNWLRADLFAGESAD